MIIKFVLCLVIFVFAGSRCFQPTNRFIYVLALVGKDRICSAGKFQLTHLSCRWVSNLHYYAFSLRHILTYGEKCSSRSLEIARCFLVMVQQNPTKLC